MSGILLLTRAEINRLRRNKRYLIFTLGLPVVLYLFFAKVGKTVYGIDFSAYYMVAMATFGAFTGALNGNAIRISEERKVGWIRQLRLTPLPASAYVIAKILTSMATTMPSIVLVLVIGRFFGNVRLPLWQWFVIAAIVWLGSTIFAALAVAIGYRYPRTRPSRSRCCCTSCSALSAGSGTRSPALSGTSARARPPSRRSRSRPT